jgi:hypothetical protein
LPRFRLGFGECLRAQLRPVGEVVVAQPASSVVIAATSSRRFIVEVLNGLNAL